MGLPGINPEIVQNVRNKYFMRQAMSSVKGLCPNFQEVKSLNDLKEAVANIGMPGILKPVGASGSKGILKLKVKHIWKILLIYYWILPPK